MAKFTEQERIERRAARRKAKTDAAWAEKTQAERNAPRVREMVFSIEWKKNKTWGLNPHLTVKVKYQGKSYFKHIAGKHTCSGSGYSKLDAVLTAAFNVNLRYLLWEYADKLAAMPEATRPSSKGLPFNIYLGEYPSVSFSEITGYAITEIVPGATWEHISDGSMHDVFILRLPEEKQ